LVFEETGLLPHVNCGVLTRDELLMLREFNSSMGIMLENVSERLMLPGQAHYGCVGKLPALRLETMATAGELGIAFTTGILAGINDWGGISPVTLDHINPERAWPMVAELRAATAEAGFELRERLCLYPEYLARPEFVRDGLCARMAALVDERGIVREEETRW